MMLLNFWSSVVDNSCSVGEEGGAAKEDLPKTAEGVFYAYAPRVYSIARRMLGNDADAEDVTQDVLLQVVRKLDTFRGESGLTTWLHRVTVNAALLHRRKQSRRRECQVDTPPEILPDQDKAPRTVCPSAAPDQQLLQRETRQLIEAAIARLPVTYRDVYVLADVEGLSNAAIGDLLNLKVPAVKSRLHRARLMMREALKSHF
jgi:RNA polymerase sigma-70 factor (ECF subfamily)